MPAGGVTKTKEAMNKVLYEALIVERLSCRNPQGA
jgi:hypothetical protein